MIPGSNEVVNNNLNHNELRIARYPGTGGRLLAATAGDPEHDRVRTPAALNSLYLHALKKHSLSSHPNKLEYSALVVMGLTIATYLSFHEHDMIHTDYLNRILKMHPNNGQNYILQRSLDHLYASRLEAQGIFRL